MPPEPTTESHRAGLRLQGLGPIAGLVVLCIAGALLNGEFATLDNAMNVLTRTAFIGIIAVGMCFVIISGGIDLSLGFIMGYETGRPAPADQPTLPRPGEVEPAPPAPPPAGAAPAYYLADPAQAAAPEAVARHPDDPARRGPSVRLI